MYSDPYWKNDGINDYFNYHISPDSGINFQFGIFPQDPYYDDANKEYKKINNSLKTLLILFPEETFAKVNLCRNCNSS